jgi:hypothetical protein
MDLYFTQLMIIVIINSVFNPRLKLIYQIENIVVSHCVYISVETLNLTKIQQWDCLLQCKAIICNRWIGHKSGRMKKLIVPLVSDLNLLYRKFTDYD